MKSLKSSTLSFLNLLKLNNNRDWFNENKELYLKAKDNVVDFVDELITEIGEFDEDILKIDANKALFRIYRDTRFSQNKQPYKTNFGISLGMGKGKKAGYYLHIEPGKSFLAGGVYQPESAVLKEIRKNIELNDQIFQNILEEETFRNNFRGLSVESKLKRIPTGFEKDHPMAEFLKLKSFTVSHPVSDEVLMKTGAVKDFAKVYKAMKPLNDFLGEPFQ